MRRRRSLALLTAAAAGGALLLPAVGQATTTIVTGSESFTSVAIDDGYGFSAIPRTTEASARCPKGAVPLTFGWSGQGAYLDYALLRPEWGMWTASMRQGNFGGKRNRAIAVCARGAVKTRLKTFKKSGVISCGRDIALGLPIYYGLNDGGKGLTGTYPVAANRWRVMTTREFRGLTALPVVLCVTRQAFTSVRVVRKAGVIAPGRVNGTVTVTCPPRHRAIGWSAVARDVPGFTPSVGESSTQPFISATHPVGARKWTVRFTTPEAKPATGPTPVTVYATCAVPA